MYHIDNPEDMGPGERLEEVAAILARGYLRLKKRSMHLVGSLREERESQESPENDLESMPDVSPHGTGD